uniref:GPN-loop GTPase n=1 Tax=Panagrolaimus sp. PS1159 TaxID=55785 RepID=A0AC35GC43_9BILA
MADPKPEPERPAVLGNTVTRDQPPVVIVLGMAGSGKSSFVQALTAHLHKDRNFPYVINLDPAVRKVIYPANIDIRDTVDYKKVMHDYQLGPNGAIMTCLNLCCTRLQEMIGLVKKRSTEFPCCLIDAPGQIEAFTWSASGSIITDSFASTFPTVIAYVVDSARSTNPTTFMSNMLYACSILYRMKLPFFLVLNKSDIVDPAFLEKWMKDYEELGTSIEDARDAYINNLTHSLSLVLDEFYSTMTTVKVSSRTSEGMEDVMAAIEKCKEEYFEKYQPAFNELLKERLEKDVQGAADMLDKVNVKEREPNMDGKEIEMEDE